MSGGVSGAVGHRMEAILTLPRVVAIFGGGLPTASSPLSLDFATKRILGFARRLAAWLVHQITIVNKYTNVSIY